MGGVFLLVLAGIGANLLKPWPLAIIVDCFLGSKPLPDWLPGVAAGADPRAAGTASAPLLFLVASVFVLHASHGLISTAQNFLAIQTGLRGLRRARNEVFACLQRLSLRFHQGNRAGDQIYRAAWDTYSIQTLFQQGLVTFITALMSLALMVVVMASMNWRLTLVALLTVPLMVAAIRIFSRKMTEHGAAAQQADSTVASLVQQNIAALPLIQSYTREDKEQATFIAKTADAQDARMAQHGWELAYWLAVTMAFGVGVTATIWVGTGEVLAGHLTVGKLWIYLAYLGQLYDPLNQLSHVGSTISTAGAAANRVFELLDTPEEVKDAPNARPAVRSPNSNPDRNLNPNLARPLTPALSPVHLPQGNGGQVGGEGGVPVVIEGAIQFDKVSFAYHAGQPVLHEVSFTLKPGECAAIIGPSGAGKSTLMNLLPRFYDPTGGAARLDGVDLRELKLRDLRAQIAVVLQEPILLPSSIADNIAYGKPGATLAEIEAAARAANAHVFIEKLPKKYDTVVGDGGARLSVGERQRINIARAFLKDAPILLLDEPTSALDTESEAAVVASLFELMKGRTTLMVAHRLTTIRRVDRVLVLEGGRLTENGRPEELAQQAGSYFARVASGQMQLG